MAEGIGEVDMMEVSLFEIQKEILSLGGRCISCKKEFEHGDLDWYEHDGGREVRESPAKLWIFFHCQKCQYDSALWKIEQQLEIEEEYKLEVLAAERQAKREMTEKVNEDLKQFVTESQSLKMEELWDNDSDEAWMDKEGIDKDLQRLVGIVNPDLTDKEVEKKLVKKEDDE